jgi:hypothetical protein
MNSTAPPRRTSRGRKHVVNLMDPKDLTKEEVAVGNYPLKSKTKKGQQENECAHKKKCKHCDSSSSDDSDSS